MPAPNGQSISKKIYGYQIIDIKTNQPANETKCMLINVTIMIWPIEVLMILINPRRRLGEKFKGTLAARSAKQARAPIYYQP